MRYTQAEKLEIIRAVEESDLSIKRTLVQLGVSRSSFYRWYRVYAEHGAEGLAPRPSTRGRTRKRRPRSPSGHLGTGPRAGSQR